MQQSRDTTVSGSYGSFLQKRPISAQSNKKPTQFSPLINSMSASYQKTIDMLQKRHQFNSPKNKEQFKIVDFSASNQKSLQQNRPKSSDKMHNSFQMDLKKNNKENNKIKANVPSTDNFFHYYNKSRKTSPYNRKSAINYSVDVDKKSFVDINKLKSKINTLDQKIKSMNIPQKDLLSQSKTKNTLTNQNQKPNQNQSFNQNYINPYQSPLQSPVFKNLKQQIQTFLAKKTTINSQKINGANNEESTESSNNKNKILFKFIKPLPSKKISDFVTSQPVSKQNVQNYDKPEVIQPQNQHQTQKRLYFVSQAIEAFQSHEHTYPKDHFYSIMQTLNCCKNIKRPSLKEIQLKKRSLIQRDYYRDKKTLVFDLDETLIHCNDSLDKSCDVVLPIVFQNGEIIKAGINVRPYARQLLAQLSQNFEIIIFTASHACYANVVLDYIDPENKFIQHRLFRDSCIQTQEGFYIKDLRVINRDLKNMVLIDNAGYSFSFQVENGIPILNYYEGKDDTELIQLMDYLNALKNEPDVREFNKNYFKLHKFDQYQDPITLIKYLYKSHLN